MEKEEKKAKILPVLRAYYREQENNFLYIPVLPNYGGGYRLDYDGKYVTLFGRDSNQKGIKETALIPVVIEVQKANPQIIEVTNIHIIVELGIISKLQKVGTNIIE